MSHPEKVPGNLGHPRRLVVTRGFTPRQAIARTLYEVISRPLAVTLLILTAVVLVASVVLILVGGPIPRLVSLAFFAGSIWSLWVPIAGTVKEARGQAKSWRVGDEVRAGATPDAYWIRTPLGSWRYQWNQIREVKRLLGFVIVEVNGDSNHHISIPVGLWIDRSTAVKGPAVGS
jgi:hypothetical protein